MGVIDLSVTLPRITYAISLDNTSFNLYMKRGQKQTDCSISAFLRENVVFVHAIKKKTHKIPEKDIEVSLKRKRQIEEYQTNIMRE